MEQEKKYCYNCGKEIGNDWEYCKHCGTSFIKENNDNKEESSKEIAFDTEKIETEKKKSNGKGLIIILTILLILSCIAIAGMIYYLIEQNNQIIDLNDDNLKLTQKNESLSKDISDLKSKNRILQVKADFYDENIVFVLEGYGKYYYTYDQVKQVTQGKTYSYWAYNKEAAIGEGYKPFGE